MRHPILAGNSSTVFVVGINGDFNVNNGGIVLSGGASPLLPTATTCHCDRTS